MAKKKSIFDRLDDAVQSALTIPKPPKKGGPPRPPPSRRAPRPTDDATVWAAEQTIQPWELPKPKKPPKKPRTFQEYMQAHAPPMSWQERERLRKKRVRWAEAATIDPKARRKLAETMTPDRQVDILRRGQGQPGEVLDRDSFNRMVFKNRLEKRLRQTKDRDERRRLQFAIEAIENPSFNPLRWTGEAVVRGLEDVASTAESGVGLLGRALLDEEQRRELAEYLGEVEKETAGYSEAITKGILPERYERAQRQQAGVGNLSDRWMRIAAASVSSGVHSAVGLGPGLAYMIGSPRQALEEYERYLKDYWGPLAHGDIRPLEEQGLTPGVMDILGVAAAGYGVAGRVGAVGRTARYPGELRLSSAGRRISRPEALARAAAFRQEPVPIIGSDVTTMGRPVGHRAVRAEEPVAQGERIQTGDRVEYRVGDETREVRASERNGLVGEEAPDVNNPIVREVDGEQAEVTSVYRQADFEQRMLPRSLVGQAISDLYWWARPSTGRGRGVLTGRGARKKAVREAREVTEDRFRGQVKAFMKDHKDIQKDVVQSTAYDRMIRYGDDAATEVPQEIAARRQRGLDKTKEQKQVLAALEQAQTHVADPSMKLQVAVAAGRMISADTEAFLIRRGFLTQERADAAKLAAKRWVREGHLADEPLDSPRRTQIREELLDHFHGDEQMTDLAMAYTDTLARAESARTGTPPEQWYERNIRQLRAVSPEQMEAIAGEPGLLRQERERAMEKRVPTANETFPLRDPETGEMRVARMVKLDYVPVLPKVGETVYLKRPEDTLRRTRQATIIEYRPDTVLVNWVPAAKSVAADLKVGDVFGMRDAGHGKTFTVTRPGWAESTDGEMQTSLRENQPITVYEHADDDPSTGGFQQEVPLATVEEYTTKRPADTATVAWTRGPDAGQPFDIPTSQIDGNSAALRGWYSGIANQVEKMPDRVGRQQVEALKKAPGIKADEWRWLKMDEVINRLFYPHGGKPVKSVSREEVRTEIARNTLLFRTERLDEGETFYEESYDVTLPGPKMGYTETLIYYPQRHIRERITLDDYSIREEAEDRWRAQRRDDAYDAWHEGRRDSAWEDWYEDLQRRLDDEEISQEEYDDLYSSGPDEGDLEQYIGEPDEYDLNEMMGEPDYEDLETIVQEMQEEADRAGGGALYQAPHFSRDYDYEEGEDYSGNLLAHLRQSDRWLGGAPIRVIEEQQSDWHQEAGIAYDYTPEGVPLRRGYKRPGGVAEADAAGRAYRQAHAEMIDMEQSWKAALQWPRSIPVKDRWRDRQGHVVIAGGDTVHVSWHDTGKVEPDIDYNDLVPGEDAPESVRVTYQEVEAARKEAERTRQEEAQARAALSGPPEAPYQGAAWEELLFREAVRQVVSEGQTRIAWTTGQQQAERYNKLLGKVQRLEWDGENLRGLTEDGELHTWHWTKFQKTSGEPKQVALSRALGSGLAKKLHDQLAEAGEQVRHDVFRVDRGEHGAQAGLVRANEIEPGDVVWVGAPTERFNEQPVYQFLAREGDERTGGETRLIDGTSTTVQRNAYEYAGRSDEFPFPFREEGMPLSEFNKVATEYQRLQYENFGETRGRPMAFLEGEDIQVGGGGFVGAYDVRLARYAKKYLGVEPRKVPLDDLRVEIVYPGDEPRSAMPDLRSPLRATIGEPRPAGEPDVPLVPAREENPDPLPVYRVLAGDTVLAESESASSALNAAYSGGANAGIWPQRIRFNEETGEWDVVSRGGTPGAMAPSYEKVYASYATAKEALQREYSSHHIHEFGADGYARGAGEVWTVEIPEKFAAEMHEKGSPLFQRRRGNILGLARLTDEGADIYLDRDWADIPTYVEEATHAVLPGWFDEADTRQDPRADYVRAHFGVESGEQIPNVANEEMTRFLQVMLSEGFVPAPQMRSLMRSLSTEMRRGYEGGAAKIVRNAEERKKFDRLLRDPEVTSFFREQFDVAPMKEFDPAPIFFQTMKTQGRLARPGVRKLPGAVRSILPSRGRRLTKHPNTMKAWEEGTFDVGPDMTAHYANAELRSRMQDEQAQRVLRYQEPIEIVDGVPTLKDGYQVYNYFGIRRANARLDEMFRRSQRYGDIETSEEPMLSADAASGSILDMDPEDFTDYVGETVGAILQEDMLFGSVEEAVARMGESDFLRLVREGKVGQIPTDIAKTFLNASGGGFSFAAASSVLHGIMAVLRIPSMLARWRMIGKAAYPVMNMAATGLLATVNQGPMLPWNFYRQYAHHSRSTRIQLLQEVGVGIAELTDVPGINAANWLERLEAKEQEVFRSAMHTLSTPEAHIRLTQMENDLAAAGYRTDSDIARLLSMVHRGDPAATRLMNQIGRNAEDGVIRFRGMRPEEQFIVRDLLFVYGWLRAAARFTVRWPLDRPVTAAAAFHIGQYGWEKLQEEFYALAWEQQGALPVGKRKEGEETLRRILDTTQLFPFKSGVDLMRPFFQLLGLQDTGMRPASFADLLSPSADFAMRSIYGQDPRFATGWWDGLKYDADPRNLPGVYWAARLIDPSLTGTKLRADRDKWGVVMNFFFGQAAPYEVKQSVSYERWLEQQPADIRTLIREQNDANQFALLGEAAAKVDGGSMSAEQLRAINADAAYNIYTGLLQSKKRREKNDSSYYLSGLERSASRGKVLQEYYPDAFAEAMAEASGLDPQGNETDAETFSQIMDEAWEDYVSDTMSETRTSIKDNLGFDAPESSKIPFKRWARDVRWLQTAPPASIERIREQMEKRGIAPGNTLALAPVIEDEMKRMVTP